MSSKEKMKHEVEEEEWEGNATEQHNWNTFYGGKFDCFWIQMSK